MGEPFRGFPDPVRVLVVGLADMLGGPQYTGSQTPPDFAGHLPFVRVLRDGGGSTNLDDRSHVDVDVFAESYAEAMRLAELIRQHLVGPPPPYYQLDKVICDEGPREMPWGGDQVRRVNAAYTIIARRVLIA